MKKEDIKIGATVRVTGAYTASWNGTEYRVTGHRPVSYGSTGELVIGIVTKASDKTVIGQTVQFHSHQLELVELEDKLKVGDKARYIGDYTPDWKGIEGVVEAVETDVVTFKVTKGNDLHHEGKVLWPYLHNLEKVPAFTFKDIKVGDRVRRTYKGAKGSVSTFEGVVHRILGSRAYAADDFMLGRSSDGADGRTTLELLERPEPHFTETAEVGTRYSVKSQSSNRFDFLFTKLEDGKWEKLHLKAAHTCTITNEGAKNFMDQREYKLIK